MEFYAAGPRLVTLAGSTASGHCVMPGRADTDNGHVCRLPVRPAKRVNGR